MELILPIDNPKKSLSPAEATALEEAIEPLKQLFHANGLGLPLSSLEKGSCSFLRAIISLCDIETQNLIDLYESYKKVRAVKTSSDKRDLLTGNHIVSILLCRTNDKVAQKFVKSVLQK
jgi:hypothetical protein